MPKIYLSTDELAGAFPASLREDATCACSTFPAVRALGKPFSVRVASEVVEIPYRVDLDTEFIHIESLSSLQRVIVCCLLTRHTNGFVRQQNLGHIVGLGHTWIPPFVVQLAGEYIVEILDLIYQKLDGLDRDVYSEFLCSNKAFLDLTGQRIASYWDCYYRNQRRKEYVGFKILEFFRSLQRKA